MKQKLEAHPLSIIVLVIFTILLAFLWVNEAGAVENTVFEPYGAFGAETCIGRYCWEVDGDSLVNIDPARAFSTSTATYFNRIRVHKTTGGSGGVNGAHYWLRLLRYPGFSTFLSSNNNTNDTATSEMYWDVEGTLEVGQSYVLQICSPTATVCALTGSYDPLYVYGDTGAPYPDADLRFSVFSNYSVDWVSPADGSTATSTPLLLTLDTDAPVGFDYTLNTSIEDTGTGNSWTQWGATVLTGPQNDFQSGVVGLENSHCYDISVSMIASPGPTQLAVSTTRNFCISAGAQFYQLPAISPVSIPYASYLPEALQQMGISTPTAVWTSMTSAFDNLFAPLRNLTGQLPGLTVASGSASGIQFASSTVGLLAYVAFAQQVLPDLPFAQTITIVLIFFLVFGIITLMRILLLRR